VTRRAAVELVELDEEVARGAVVGAVACLAWIAVDVVTFSPHTDLP